MPSSNCSLDSTKGAGNPICSFWQYCFSTLAAPVLRASLLMCGGLDAVAKSLFHEGSSAKPPTSTLSGNCGRLRGVPASVHAGFVTFNHVPHAEWLNRWNGLLPSDSRSVRAHQRRSDCEHSAKKSRRRISGFFRRYPPIHAADLGSMITIRIKRLTSLS